MCLPVFLHDRCSPDRRVHPSESSFTFIDPEGVTERVQAKRLVVASSERGCGRCQRVGGFFTVWQAVLYVGKELEYVLSKYFIDNMDLIFYILTMWNGERNSKPLN